MDGGLDRNQLRIANLFASLEIQLTGEDAIWFFRVVERHAELVAHQRTMLIDGADVLLERRTRQAVAADESANDVLARTRLDSGSQFKREARKALCNLRGLDFGDAEDVVTALGAARPAMNFGAVQFAIAGELSVHCRYNLLVPRLNHLTYSTLEYN